VTYRPSRALSAAGGPVLDAEDRVLPVEPAYKDKWEIPGGAIEPGEPPARRARGSSPRSWGLTIRLERYLEENGVPDPGNAAQVRA
jgi:8-oxo-dGTP pyrophosphatase MutT (NUDIX family)